MNVVDYARSCKMNAARCVIRSLWTAPTSMIGLGIGACCTPFGARWRTDSGVVEICGGGVAWLLEHATVLPGGVLAITFGEVVLARSEAALDMTRDHERVHVQQARRWGPLFIPAYLFASIIAMLKGRPAYRGNVFEIEAYAVSDGRRMSHRDEN